MKNRKVHSGLNLLRIIMMLQIVYGHLVLYGGTKEAMILQGKTTEFIYRLCFFMSRCPVFVLVTLSGYFLVEKKEIFAYVKNKVKATWIVMAFYSVLLGVLAYIAEKTLVTLFCGEKFMGGGTEFIKQILKSIMPVLSNQWYFMTNYIIVLCLAPFMNITLNKITKNQYRILLTGSFIILGIWPLLTYISNIFNMHFILDHLTGKSLIDFLMMYCLGGYLKKYPIKPKKKYVPLIIFLLCGLINFLLYYLFEAYREASSWNDNPLSVIQVISIIVFFSNMEWNNSLVDKISKLNIGVYLITEHGRVRELLWSKLSYDVIKSENIMLLYFKIITAVLFVYFICIMIEYLRSILFDKLKKRGNLL